MIQTKNIVQFRPEFSHLRHSLSPGIDGPGRPIPQGMQFRHRLRFPMRTMTCFKCNKMGHMLNPEVSRMSTYTVMLHLRVRNIIQPRKCSQKIPDLSSLHFQNYYKFVFGQLHKRIREWENITMKNNCPTETLFWIKHERLENGSIECLDKVGVCQPPLIVAPLTVEPTKPRLCLNLMFLNNWIKNISFSLATLKDIPRVVRKGAYFTSLDDKSGFDNVNLNENSILFLFQNFGIWIQTKQLRLPHLKLASYIRREFNVPLFLYIDDRLID
ncbi:hypothetical protein MAR_014744 [Mya arenaria]|uniref:Reverse transcriptase domain-containing protein n=1 Tax=Mya arenaria TaxID=6604 RepID=A0ABY7FF39_MYAAR|nr:hypothetical protein MAR_014744 [Mya arenaria]